MMGLAKGSQVDCVETEEGVLIVPVGRTRAKYKCELYVQLEV
jgi:hypothetical protein